MQFSFRESVEPIYRELVGLLLQTPSTSLEQGTIENVLERLFDTKSGFFQKFYQELIQSETKGNKAKSFRKAQLALLKTPGYEHPFYWSPFVLVGNWQ